MDNQSIRTARHRKAVLALAAALVVGGLTACGTAGATPPRTTGAASQAGPSAPVAAQPSTRMLTVDGHRLAFYVTSGDNRLPVIVLDSGGGLDASYWKKVAPVLARRTGAEIITYDRSGEGESPYVPGPWRAPNAAADLAAGLAQLGVTKDVVLVSHSLAGEIATYFVRAHPRVVAGAVLVDASLPPFYTTAETERIVAASQQQIDALRSRPLTTATRQLLDEADDYGPVHLAYHELSWPASVPATAVVSATTPFPTALDAGLWRQAQRKFADAAPNRQLLVADHSSHDVPLDRPDVVIRAVEAMVKQVGAAGTANSRPH
ncbi:alpha/beta fold hydrolase [Streptacidiphilus jiangxiensis]|uniref:Pimeloyl-ACP methyl ester carboxylesterase n=1 Tax=Streptacidiphilus jiangxiensis TaxID=235985 RepID=A0A1H7P6Z7_STRJI|nr:alpha/beta hydrolase [Streptacidiphilus jiangxiensis]SEL31399.1 Pimeloyl-ACP methyl ester carboxylesterase [Streptacidiphilus jiangxiensis]